MRTFAQKYLLGAGIFLLPALVLAGQDRSGGDPKKIDTSTIEMLVTGSGLKAAMLNYVNTIALDQFKTTDEDSVVVLSTLKPLLWNGALQKDIQNSEYIVSHSCLDRYSAEVPASTEVGNLGSGICFDAAKLASDYQNLSAEEMMINLASLAFHEHVHHFQPKGNRSDQNERQAYLFSAYVKITAKTVQVPLLKWANPVKAAAIGSNHNCSPTKTQIQASGDVLKERLYSTIKADLLKNNFKVPSQEEVHLYGTGGSTVFYSLEFALADGTPVYLRLEGVDHTKEPVEIVPSYDSEGNVLKCRYRTKEMVMTSVYNANTKFEILKDNRRLPNQFYSDFTPNP